MSYKIGNEASPLVNRCTSTISAPYAEIIQAIHRNLNNSEIKGAAANTDELSQG